jgi:1,6-anhydro-N-acetylmuramate kinase
MTNMNPLVVYSQAGLNAGTAVSRGDMALAKFQGDWLRRALAMESEEYAKEARKTYEDSYTAARNVKVRP